MADASVYGNGEKSPACELHRQAQGCDLRSMESDDRQRDWLTEPERATGLLALVLFIGGFITLAATVGGLGWFIATAIRAAGWDG